MTTIHTAQATSERSATAVKPLASPAIEIVPTSARTAVEPPFECHDRRPVTTGTLIHDRTAMVDGRVRDQSRGRRATGAAARPVSSRRRDLVDQDLVVETVVVPVAGGAAHRLISARSVIR
jgi:hypothetical protein